MTTGHELQCEPSARNLRWAGAVLALGAAVFIFHFAATALYVAPLNPLKLALLEPLRRYIEPFFGQGWQLFAPDPLVKSPFLIVQCRTTDPRSGSLRDSEPLQVSEALYALHHQYRLTPAFRLRRMQTAGLTLTNPMHDPLTEAVVSLGTSEDAKLRGMAEAAEARLRENRERGAEVFRRVASAECLRHFPDRQIHAVKASVLRVGAARFSERMDRKAKASVDRIDFDWAPFAADVSSY